MALFASIRWKRYRSFQFTGDATPCNLCGGTDFEVVARRDRWLQPLTNVMCRQCGLVFLSPMPTDEELDQHYRNDFWQRSQGGREPNAKQIKRAMRGAEGRLAALEKVLKPGARILDVGAGGGEFVALAQRRGYDAEGIEPGEDYANYARKTYGVRMHNSSLADTDLGGRRFDIVTTNHAVEHLRDPLDSLRRMHAVLEPGGHLLIAVPDLAEDRWPWRWFQPAHLFGFTPETLLMMAAKAGFGRSESDRPTSTSMLLHALAQPDPDWFRFPDHPTAWSAMFKERTAMRYLLANKSYGRIPGRIRYWYQDRRQ